MRNWNEMFANRTEDMRRSAVRDLLQLTAQPDMISFAGGLPAPELFPVDEIAEAAANVLKSNPTAALQYSQTEGLSDLRDWIAERLQADGIHARRENILITTGAQQALELIGKVLINPGEPVLAENPTYLGALTAWRPLGARFVPVCTDHEGIVADELFVPPHAPAKLLYTIPNFQNPSGVTLSLQRRQDLLRVLAGASTLIVEDDPYRELSFDQSRLPTLLTLDSQACGDIDSSRVVQVGTFSKTLAPGFRIGWVAAAAQLIEKLALAKQASDLHTSTWCQTVAFEVLRGGVMDRTVPRLRREYARRCATMEKRLRDHFSPQARWLTPRGGMFLFVELPTEVEARHFLRRALEHKIAFVPGEEFYLDCAASHTIRLNFSNSNEDKIEQGIKRLTAALKDYLENDHVPCAPERTPVH